MWRFYEDDVRVSKGVVRRVRTGIHCLVCFAGQ